MSKTDSVERKRARLVLSDPCQTYRVRALYEGTIQELRADTPAVALPADADPAVHATIQPGASVGEFAEGIYWTQDREKQPLAELLTRLDDLPPGERVFVRHHEALRGSGEFDIYYAVEVRPGECPRAGTVIAAGDPEVLYRFVVDGRTCRIQIGAGASLLASAVLVEGRLKIHLPDELAGQVPTAVLRQAVRDLQGRIGKRPRRTRSKMSWAEGWLYRALGPAGDVPKPLDEEGEVSWEVLGMQDEGHVLLSSVHEPPALGPAWSTREVQYMPGYFLLTSAESSIAVHRVEKDGRHILSVLSA